MGRKSGTATLRESQRRLVETRVQIKRLKIFQVLKKNSDAVLHIFDHMDEMGLFQDDDKEAPRAIPESELSNRRREIRVSAAKFEVVGDDEVF